MEIKIISRLTRPFSISSTFPTNHPEHYLVQQKRLDHHFFEYNTDSIMNILLVPERRPYHRSVWTVIDCVLVIEERSKVIVWVIQAASGLRNTFFDDRCGAGFSNDVFW